MRYPPRLAHLCTSAELTAKLSPSYALAHRVDPEEAALVVARGLTGRLRDDLLAACWQALLAARKRPNEAALLERIFEKLKERPLRPGRAKEPGPALSAFWLLLGLEAGTASDAARKALESEAGRAMAEQGLAEAGRLLADDLLR